MLVSDSKDGREEPHGSDGTGRGGAYMMKRRARVTAVHLGCKSVTIPIDPKRSKGSFLSKTRVWTDMSVPLFI